MEADRRSKDQMCFGVPANQRSLWRVSSCGNTQIQHTLLFVSPLFFLSLDNDNSVGNSLLVASVEVKNLVRMTLTTSFKEHYSRLTTGAGGDRNVDGFNKAMDPKRTVARP